MHEIDFGRFNPLEFFDRAPILIRIFAVCMALVILGAVFSFLRILAFAGGLVVLIFAASVWIFIKSSIR